MDHLGQQRISGNWRKRAWELTGQVVSAKGDTNVDQVVQPSGHDGFAVVGDGGDELGLEELVAVEEDVVTVPAASGCDQTRAEVGESELEGLSIVAGHFGLLLRCSQLLACGSHLESTEVNEPEGTDSWDGKGDAVGPLGGHFRVRWVPASVVEAQKEDNEDGLVEELTPSLHQERAGDFAASVKTIFLGGDFARANGVLHAGCCRHGVFTTNTNAVEEKGPCVADDPTVQSGTPSADKHDETKKHDGCILDQTPSTTEPSLG